jgi:hypothetical protein
MGLKVTQVEDEGFHRLAVVLFAMIRLYVTEPMIVRVVGKAGIDWQEFDPEEFRYGEYEPRVQLETTVNSQKAQEADNAKEMFAAFLNDPGINQDELKKLVLRRGFDLDPDEVDTLMTPDPMQMQPGMPGMPPGAPPMGPEVGMPPEMGGLPPEAMPAPMPEEMMV